MIIQQELERHGVPVKRKTTIYCNSLDEVSGEGRYFLEEFEYQIEHNIKAAIESAKKLRDILENFLSENEGQDKGELADAAQSLGVKFREWWDDVECPFMQLFKLTERSEQYMFETLEARKGTNIIKAIRFDDSTTKDPLVIVIGEDSHDMAANLEQHLIEAQDRHEDRMMSVRYPTPSHSS